MVKSTDTEFQAFVTTLKSKLEIARNTLHDHMEYSGHEDGKNKILERVADQYFDALKFISGSSHLASSKEMTSS